MGPRSRSLFLRLLLLAFFLGSTIADVKPYISTAAEINTECKTCPHTLCTNQLALSYTDALNVTCWTRGTKIVGDNLWLKSDLGCYVTQYDMVQYAGDYTKDLAYCGKASEDEHLTTEDATLQYKTECRACPQVDCDVAAYLPEETDVTLTCWTDQAQIIIDDPYWMKTTNNCYVAEKGLYSKPDRTYLDNCGPIPFLELANHNGENGTTEIDKRGNVSTKYLINVTVGEDYAYCYSCPNTKCNSEKRYKFNEEVWLQCLYEDKNSTWWSETTDFCYVKNSDFWQSPEGDYYGNPLCEYFEDGSDKHVLSIVRFGRWLRSLM